MPPNVQTPKKGECVSRTFESMMLTGTQESDRREPSSSNSNQREATTTDDARGKRDESAIVTRTKESSEDSSYAHQKESKPIVIDGRGIIYTVAFLADEKHVLSGGLEGKIRRWRMEDGKEVGAPMNAGSFVFNVTVSPDEKWIVSGTRNGFVVWNAENHSKVTEWKAHNGGVYAVDVSPDGTRIATGSGDRTVCVWSLSTGERLLDPFKHDKSVVAAKFSPNGRLIATATGDCVRVHDSQNGGLLREFPVGVNSTWNQSLAWASDSKQLFALSRDGNIHCLNVSTRTTLSKWANHSSKDPRCIALASNGTFIAVTANSSVSFWDTATHEQIGSVIKYTHNIWCMALSANYDLVVGGGERITIRGLYGILPHHYLHNVCVCA